MAFKTKLDYSNNRQIKQHIETLTVLSGATSFGVPFSYLPTGPNLSTSAVTETYSLLGSTFSGNSGTTIYTWFDPRMELGASALSALTPSNSGTVQTTGVIFTANSTTVIDGNTIALNYSGVSFSIDSIAMVSLGGGNYSGTVSTNILNILTASTTDFTGRTIWVDVSGITRTNDLIINNNPQIGYVWTCIDSEGKGGWQSYSGGTSGGSGTDIYVTGGTYSAGTAIFINTTGGTFSVSGFSTGNTSSYWSASTGTNAIVPIFSDNIASSSNSIAVGYQTKSFGIYSYSEGYQTTANELATHAEGSLTTALGAYSHAEGNSTTTIGIASHAEGSATTANGHYSHAGGTGGVASGIGSFVHGSSIATGTTTIVLGDGLIGSKNNTTYVNELNIKSVGAGPSIVDIGIDSSGFVVNNASDINLKENICLIDNPLDKVKALDGVYYEWKDKESGGYARKIGFIAQQIENIVPELVYTHNNGVKTVHYKDVTALLVEAIKELSTSKTINNDLLYTQTILAEDNNIELNYSGNSITSIGGGIKVLNALSEGGDAEFITNENGNWITNNDLIPNKLTIPFYTPTSSNDSNGNIGNMTRDDEFLYIKTSVKWKRIKMEDF